MQGSAKTGCRERRLQTLRLHHAKSYAGALDLSRSLEAPRRGCFTESHLELIFTCLKASLEYTPQFNTTADNFEKNGTFILALIGTHATALTNVKLELVKITL